MTAGRRAWGFEFEFASDDEELTATVDWCFADLPTVADADNLLSAMRSPRTDPDDVARLDVSLTRRGQPAEDYGQRWPELEVVALLTAVINGQARRSAGDRTVLHAAVFGGPAGCVVLCGETGSGKSTLAAAAARRGWWHLSDDLAMVDVARRTVTPYPRPIMLRHGTQRVLAGLPWPPVHTPAGYDRFVGTDLFVPASALGARTCSEPLPLVALGFLSRSTESSLRRMGRAATLHALTVHSANLPDRAASEFDELVTLAETVEGWEAGVADVGSTLDLLAPMVGQPVA